MILHKPLAQIENKNPMNFMKHLPIRLVASILFNFVLIFQGISGFHDFVIIGEGEAT